MLVIINSEGLSVDPQAAIDGAIEDAFFVLLSSLRGIHIDPLRKALARAGYVADTIPASIPAEVHARIMALSDEVMSLPLDVPWIARYAALAVAQIAEQVIGARDDLTATSLADSIRNLMAHEVWEKRQAWATAASAEAEA